MEKKNIYAGTGISYNDDLSNRCKYIYFALIADHIKVIGKNATFI